MTPNFCSFSTFKGKNVLFLLDFHNTDEIVCYFWYDCKAVSLLPVTCL